MPRLIDAEVAEKNWWQELRTNYADDYGKGFQAGLLAVIRQPTIDPAPQWIPVTERLPEIVKTTKVHRNVYRRSDRVLCACLQTNGKRMVKEGYAEFFNDYPEPNWKIPGTIHSVTHWLPLPEPPRGR